MVGTGRQVQWCVPQPISLVGISPVVQEQLHNLVIAIAGSEVQSCASLVIGCTGIRSIFQQLLHCFHIVGIG